MQTLEKQIVAGTGVLRRHEGGLVRFLVRPGQTAHELAVVEIKAWRGVQPPPHTHRHEDETFLVSEGELLFTIGEKTLTATPGTVVYAPRGIRHHYQIRSDWARFTMIITPGQFAGYFWELTEDASTDELPPCPGGPPTAGEIARRQQLAAAYGIVY
jgi:quercetin dioxygenase-like cupin family protein